MGRPKTIETEDLLRVAREVFLEGGAFGSTKEIAARAGVSEAALFKRFPTKAALFLAAMAPPPPDVDFIVGAARMERDPHKALKILARRILAHYRAAIPRMLHLITHPAIGLDAFGGHAGKGGAFALDGAVADYFANEHAKGHIHAPNAMAASGVLIATLHSVVLFELMGVHGGEIPAAAIDAMIDAVWSGFAPHKASKTRRRK